MWLFFFLNVLLLLAACDCSAIIANFKKVNVKDSHWSTASVKEAKTEIMTSVMCGLESGQSCDAIKCKDGNCETGAPLNCSHILGRGQDGTDRIAYNRAGYKEIQSPRVVQVQEPNIHADVHIDTSYAACATENVRVVDTTGHISQAHTRRHVGFRGKILVCAMWYMNCGSYKIGGDAYREEPSLLIGHNSGCMESFVGERLVMAFGGVKAGGWPSNSAEVFDGVKWKEVAAPLKNKLGGALVSISDEEMIHIGGANAATDNHKKIMHYNLLEDKWVYKKDIPFGWKYANCAYAESYQGKRTVICAMGLPQDENDFAEDNQVLAYDVQDDAWTDLGVSISSANHRYSSLAFIHGNSLFVIGGKEKVSAGLSDKVGTLNLGTLVWTEMGTMEKAGNKNELAFVWQKILVSAK